MKPKELIRRANKIGRKDIFLFEDMKEIVEQKQVVPCFIYFSCYSSSQSRVHFIIIYLSFTPIYSNINLLPYLSLLSFLFYPPPPYNPYFLSLQFSSNYHFLLFSQPYYLYFISSLYTQLT